MEAVFGSLSPGALVLLGACIAIALAFEFVNGFHDTANAVATVIYTNTLKPWRAVILSGVCNFLGVFVGGIAVAMSILYLLPSELLVGGGTGLGLALVLSLLIGAIVWNLGTWYLGLPASSSHTMIGAIIGVGVANSLRPGHVFGQGVNWGKAADVGVSLLVSPLFGLSCAAGLLLLMKRLTRDPRLFTPPEGDAPPPGWIRALLIGTCSGVSFAHGSNDGQKGIGLVMLILIGIVPAGFALDLSAPPERIAATERALGEVVAALGSAEPSRLATTAPGATPQGAPALTAATTPVERTRGLALRLHGLLAGKTAVSQFSAQERWEFRNGLIELSGATKQLGPELGPERQRVLRGAVERSRGLTDYAPTWVMVAVALALGVGTMVGWKRIVVTVGEKIGKTHLTYGQGASAELVAASTIGVAATLGLPVSTTHVLSSGVAGTMVSNGSALQPQTVRNIALAWLLTLPATMLLSGGLFFLLSLFLA